jgi:putative NADH-flavin reductase
MRIVVFGASGRTGRLVVKEAVEREHRVTAFLRDASKQWFPDAVKAFQGDPNDATAVGDALAGADSVISAVGPIEGLTTDEVSQLTSTIVDVMQRSGPRRLVLAGNTAVFTDDEVTGAFANVAAEHRRDLAIVRDSSLDWTMLAPAMLRNEKVAGRFEATLDGPAPGHSIARGDFALAMLDALDRPAWVGHAVGVSS